MSAKATFWAWTQTEIKPIAKFVLLALANRHNTDTGKCYPSIAKMVEDTGLGRSAIMRAIKELEAAGLVNCDRSYGRSTFYTLSIGRFIEEPVSERDQSRRETSLPERPQPVSERDRTSLGERPKPKRNLKGEPKNNTNDHFDQFWEMWPKKVGKAAARKSWAKIKKPREVLELIATNLEMRANAGQWTDMQYVPNPTTYLNQQRWEDEVYTNETHQQGNGKYQHLSEGLTDTSWLD